jgi:hypothetical protein
MALVVVVLVNEALMDCPGPPAWLAVNMSEAGKFVKTPRVREREVRAIERRDPRDNHSIVEKTPELAASARMLELTQRFGLDLPDALPGHRKLLANLFQSVVGVHADAETHA